MNVILIIFVGLGFASGMLGAMRGSGALAIFGCLILMCASIGVGVYNSTPTAMDVYEHKTELQKTYQGKKCIDSIVVYKAGFNK